MRIIHSLSAMALSAFFLGPIAPAALGSKVALLGDVEVHESSVFLSDLLPPRIPAGVRTPAHNILIGSAPSPGGARVFEGARVAGLLGVDLASEISIPQQIVVRRSGRRITREEVVAAIRSALDHSGFSDSDVQPDDLRIFPSVMVSSAHSELHVRRIDFDDVLKEARFLMAERDALPFLVTAELRNRIAIPTTSRETVAGPASAPSSVPGNSLTASGPPAPPADRLEELVGLRSLQHAAFGASANAPRIGTVTLVQPGKPAVLCLSSSEIQMSLDVMPLERGALNQTIRVKLPGTGKVLQAQVTGARRLAATF